MYLFTGKDMEDMMRIFGILMLVVALSGCATLETTYTEEEFLSLLEDATIAKRHYRECVAHVWTKNNGIINMKYYRYPWEEAL